MISTKAILAIALTGLGAATVSTDAYLMFRPHARLSPPKETETPRAPPPAPARELVARAEVASVPITIEPVLVYGVLPRHRTAAPKPARGLVPCSDWRSLESGPAGHGVRTLCPEGAQAANK